MTHRSRPIRALLLAVFLALSAAPALAQEPGVNTAFPRVAISQTGAAFTFTPNKQVVEQGDFVRWMNDPSGFLHTTTSGSGCAADGLWSLSLNPGSQVTRQFLEVPRSIPYFCSPHCLSNMVGTVLVTAPVDLKVTFASTVLTLNWGGGCGLYKVFRSDNRGFPGASTITFPPSGGDAGTTVNDVTDTPPGSVLYYLVMNNC